MIFLLDLPLNNQWGPSLVRSPNLPRASGVLGPNTPPGLFCWILAERQQSQRTSIASFWFKLVKEPVAGIGTLCGKTQGVLQK